MDVTTPAFSRKPDNKLLLANTHGGAQVCRSKFYNAVVALAGEAGIDESNIQLEGDPMDNKFEIKFIGSASTAHALQLYQSLQLGRGKWKEQVVEGGDGNRIKFYIQPDKNAATIKKEVCAKRLRDIVQDFLGVEKQVFVRKSTGSVLVDRRVLASMIIVDENVVKIGWFHAKRVELRLEQEKVEEQFHLSLGGGVSSP